MRRSMHRTTTAAVLLGIAMVAAPGCDDGATYSTSTPTPAPKSTAQQGEPAPAAPGAPSDAPPGRRQSSSVLGKARVKGAFKRGLKKPLKRFFKGAFKRAPYKAR